MSLRVVGILYKSEFCPIPLTIVIGLGAYVIAVGMGLALSVGARCPQPVGSIDENHDGRHDVDTRLCSSTLETKYMKSLLLGAVVAAGLTLGAPSASALALLGQEPPASKIFDAGNGLEWVYAAPCAGEDPSCGVVQLHHGFRFATDSEWIDSFGDLAGLIAAFETSDDDQFDQGVCAAPEFSTNFDHCDPNDVNGGYVWHSPFAPDADHRNFFAAETFLVRTARIAEPGTLAILGLGLVGLGVARRKKAA